MAYVCKNACESHKLRGGRFSEKYNLGAKYCKKCDGFFKNEDRNCFCCGCQYRKSARCLTLKIRKEKKIQVCHGGRNAAPYWIDLGIPSRDEGQKKL